MNTPLQLPEIRFTKVTLGNGLDVIARRQAHLPITAVNLWYHVGSKNEERRQRGFAHLFEHLMFEGSEHYPGDFFQPLQRLGVGINGSTSADRTNYYEDAPAAHMELCLAMESDRMANLLPALDDRKLRVQKDVVKNEYRQNYENRPYGQVWRLLAEALYPPEHPYSWLTIGMMEDIEAATRDDVEAFFRRFYVPSNASLCLVGDLDEDAAIALADRYFGSIPGGAKAIQPRSTEVSLGNNLERIYYDRVELDRLYQVWPTVPHYTNEDAPLALLADILARGRASRLYRRLVVETELAQNVSAFHASRELAGTFGWVVTARPGRDLGHCREIFEAELADLARQGPTPEELERARNGRVAGLVYAVDNVGGFGGVADRLNAYNTYLGNPDYFASDVRRYLEATPEAVRQAAQRYLEGKPSVALTVRGRSETTTATLPAIDRSIRPTPAPAVAFQAPEPEVLKLASGATLWVIPRRDLPIVAATSVVRAAGAASHGADRGGLANLTSSLMDEGTRRFSAEQLADAIERLGTHLSASAGWDGSYVSLQCLTPHLAESLELAAEVLTAPTFPDSEFERVRSQTVAALRAGRDRAETLAHLAFLQHLYGPEHPYGVPLDGVEETVSRLDRDDLRAFHKLQQRPSDSAWVVAGDVDPSEVARLLDERLTEWSNAEGSSPTGPSPADTPKATPKLVLIDRPGAPQSVVRVGHVGLPRSHPDHDALLLFNQILGGQFTSRLNAVLRESKGYTYGVRSHFDFRRGPGPFAIGASLESARLADALVDLRNEVEALLESRPPTQDELEDARRSLIEGQARRFETPSALVSRYAGLFIHDLPPDHHAGLADRLNLVTIDAMLDAARRAIRPDAFVTIVVADAATVSEPLNRLGWGPVEAG